MKQKDSFILADDWNDDLAILLEDVRNDPRRDIWLWLYLVIYKKAQLPYASCNGSTMREEIARFVESRQSILRRLGELTDHHLLSTERIKWIDQSERQYRWLQPRIQRMTTEGTHSGLPQGLVHLTGRSRLIAMIDLWDVYIAEKAEKIELLHNEWLQHKARDSDFEWFGEKKEGPLRCKCAWDWLKKNRLPPHLIATPITNYTELVMFFDHADYGPTEQKAIIKAIKQLWSRRQFDVRAVDKKQVNVMLAKSAISLLDGLAEKHKLKRAEVLERLITMESETGEYLAGKP
ncbi:hypothetical protein AB1H94_03045 [Pseudomonas fulva]|uniref:hypothetical protein n=1 Tax=Pseudomonas TaxID=286 RepID=UPI001F2829E9|nr:MULTISPECIES: hypothetical protein [Pseudomonas]MCE5975298.1 hypothetical protein [Pseudomonas sp. JR33AA]MDF3928767.1 hypothetical protein [Pseudomonas putida]